MWALAAAFKGKIENKSAKKAGDRKLVYLNA